MADPLKKVLTEYGVDMKKTMDRFVGDEDLYAECLTKFLSDSSWPLLKNAYEHKEYKEMFEYAHTLKGVTGNLGLTPLYNAVSDMVGALRFEQYEKVDGLYELVEAELSRLLRVLGQSGEE